MNAADLLLPIQNVARKALEQGITIGRRDALMKVVRALLAAQNFREALLAVEALVAKENEKHG